MRLSAAVSPEIDAGTRLLGEHFADHGQPKLQPQVRKNKTASLITRKGCADGE